MPRYYDAPPVHCFEGKKGQELIIEFCTSLYRVEVCIETNSLLKEGGGLYSVVLSEHFCLYDTLLVGLGSTHVEW